MAKTLERKGTSIEKDTAVEKGGAIEVDLDDLPGFDRGRQLCECDHGDDDGYVPCGRKAKWRVSIDCECGENHPRTVEILCSRCLSTLRYSRSRESITARRL